MSLWFLFLFWIRYSQIQYQLSLCSLNVHDVPLQFLKVFFYWAPICLLSSLVNFFNAYALNMQCPLCIHLQNVVYAYCQVYLGKTRNKKVHHLITQQNQSCYLLMNVFSFQILVNDIHHHKLAVLVFLLHCLFWVHIIKGIICCICEEVCTSFLSKFKMF